MGLFDRSAEPQKTSDIRDAIPGTTQPVSQSAEGIKPQNIELEIAELFHVNENFLRDVEKELNVQQERVERSAKEGARLYEDVRSGISEVTLASFTLPLGKETKDPAEIPDLIADAWNNNQTDNRNENALAQAKALLTSFGIVAARDEEYRTAVLAIGLATQPQSLLQNREVINQLEQICSQSTTNSRHAKYKMITQIKEYELNPDKKVLKVLRPAPAPALPDQSVSSPNPTPTVTEYSPQSPPTLVKAPELTPA
ncbi:hypothetical protein HY382_02305 [Candidatus Curtissbacteria bacterium]|nr:hypothetical protein [Candidatus Curtissbacteria bacterium]